MLQRNLMTPLTQIRAPWIFSFFGTASEITDSLRSFATTSRINVRFVRGSKMQTVTAMFDEIAAALQFPYYFGGNWAALDECIADLSWIAGDGLVLCVLDAPLLLLSDREQIHLFIKIVTGAAEEWSRPTAFRPAKPFHTVFQAESKGDLAHDLLSAELTFNGRLR